MSVQIMHINPNLITKLSTNLNVYRKENKLCDFTIYSKDSKILYVHKIILASTSTYFAKIFDSECRQNFMIFNRISGDILVRIVEYMYTGCIEVTFENAREIFDAASLLGLDDLVEFSKVLIDGIKNENVWSLLKFGETMMNDDLKNACFKWIFENLEVVAESKDMENLCFDTIKEIMKRKNEFDLCEDKFHTMIMKWIKFDEETRKCHAKELIECLRFDFMSKEYLRSDEMSKTAALIDDTKSCQKYDERKYKRRKLSSPLTSHENSLYVVTETNIHKFDPNTQNLTQHCILPSIESSHSCITTFKCFGIGNGSFFLIILNQSVVRGSCIEIKLYSKEREEWIDVPKLKKPDDFYGVYYKDKIFLYQPGLKKFQIFDLINGNWIEKTNNSAKIKCLCILYDHIYAYGHHDDKYELYRSECSDEKFLSWECLTTFSNITNNSNIQKIVGYNNYIYHFADTGYCIFDLIMKRWFNDFVAYEKDLKDEGKGIVIPFYQRANNCFFDKLKYEWMINTKPYHENMKFRDVCLHKNEFYVTDGKIVQVYNAPFFDFNRKFEIPFSEDEDKSIQFLISN